MAVPEQKPAESSAVLQPDDVLTQVALPPTIDSHTE